MLQPLLVLDFKLEVQEGWKQGIPVPQKPHQFHTIGSYNLSVTSSHFHIESKKLRNRIWNKNPLMHLISNASQSAYFD